MIELLLSFDYGCWMQLSITEFALARGVSRQRALALVSSGLVAARRVGHSWIIEESELRRRTADRRPLSLRVSVWLFDSISVVDSAGLNAQERFFVGKHLNELRRAGDPLRLLYGWLRTRQFRVVDVAANPADLLAFRVDVRVVPSGTSDARAGLSSSGEFEGYVQADDLDGLLRDCLLVSSATTNVRLHVVTNSPSRPAPVGLVIADLVDWNRPREDGRALDLLKTALESAGSLKQSETRKAGELVSDRVLFQDVIPYETPHSLAELEGPATGSMILPHTIHWGPERAVDLDTLDGRSKAYRAIVREGTSAQQAELLNAELLIDIWPSLRLPVRARLLWETRFPELAR
jgi:hypothetical protein